MRLCDQVGVTRCDDAVVVVVRLLPPWIELQIFRLPPLREKGQQPGRVGQERGLRRKRRKGLDEGGRA
jgi:hypothetical protein